MRPEPNASIAFQGMEIHIHQNERCILVVFGPNLQVLPTRIYCVIRKTLLSILSHDPSQMLTAIVVDMVLLQILDTMFCLLINLRNLWRKINDLFTALKLFNQLKIRRVNRVSVIQHIHRFKLITTAHRFVQFV